MIHNYNTLHEDDLRDLMWQAAGHDSPGKAKRRQRTKEGAATSNHKPQPHRQLYSADVGEVLMLP